MEFVDEKMSSPTELSPVTLPTPGTPTLTSASNGTNVDNGPGTKPAISERKSAQSPPCGCTGRNLVVCIDGTANQFGMKNTNVVELYSRLEKNEDQLTYYNSGIGTFVKESKASPRHWRQTFDHTVDMAIAWNFKRIVLSAYQWLSEKYRKDDRIFLLGKSGPYEPPAFDQVGLLPEGNNDQISFAYELYAAAMAHRKRIWHRAFKDSQHKGAYNTEEALCANFKRTLSRDNVKVHFVGAWDTVSSIGIIKGPSLPETTTGMAHVCAFRHALALDELRVKFLPEYANGGAGPSSSSAMSKGNIKEVWFAGSHSDIGGGNSPNLEADQFGPASRWMSYEAQRWGLRLRPFEGKWRPFKPNPSMSLVWRIIEYLPVTRLSYRPDRSSNDQRRWPPPLGSPRRVMENQMIHESVFDPELDRDYKPLAHLPENVRYERESLCTKNMLELDPYTSVPVLVDQVIKGKLPEEDRGVLVTLASSKESGRRMMDIPDASRMLFTALEGEAEGDDSDLHRKQRIKDLLLALGAFPSLPSDAMPYANVKLRGLLPSEKEEDGPEVRRAVNNIMHVFGNGPTLTLRPPQDHSLLIPVLSVTFSPDAARVAWGLENGAIRVYTVATGASLTLYGHTEQVNSVAFSPSGKHLVSGSSDGTVRLWDASTGEIVLEQGHARRVLCVAFSPDGELIGSGSDDCMIRLWNVGQGGVAVGEPLQGHADWIQSVSFSPDGRSIASGSSDGSICIHDVHTRRPVGELISGDRRNVCSLSYSPDGKRVCSSSDKTIRVWDTQTHQVTLGPLQKRSGTVYSVAFSPDGKYFVSGSYDGAVRIWNAQTGQTIGKPLQGHKSSVRSVAFASSPNDKRIVSGGSDGLVMIWDMEVD
ncbi:WD40 repeat-like protein [Punctularia strigosozonata HHB-11173 SS5]|uniref:WD40 repeat-like protein n=1 Tax=Punctularia strigosozonata (strain HHB-11173) TaxID=741275 RepID=UPI00044184F7|nr:WD40 repeat-like protein [Punctularia strigosozonata HHB-11173 SS5]EIN08082.1 WD40 repeat-like protein [Punctularia strigosozonata HHB-11173 SS5]